MSVGKHQTLSRNQSLVKINELNDLFLDELLVKPMARTWSYYVRNQVLTVLPRNHRETCQN